ncbi:MAG TPA: universal stress protein [Solirubrobacteraceae bacterium]|nr:universal stress protein [Solirubrobacteraceae bacterium]
MTTSVIVSYDGTTNDDDALALARMLAVGGAVLSLAYVRHSQEYDPRREEIGIYDADRRLEHGALWLEEPDIERHVVVDPSTSAGLAKLAASEGARLILFGSDYRTPPGRVEPGGSAQGLLQGSPVAIGVAAAGLRTRAAERIQTISVAGGANGAAHESAEALAQALGAEVLTGGGNADLILVDSQSNGPEGRITLGGSTRAQLDSARGSVIVLPRGTSLSF